MGRSPCCEKVGLKKGRWTAEEDEKLKKYINANGEGSWRSLPKNAGLLRCGKSCRLRWTNYLREDIKRGNFTADEEETIVKLHRLLGNKWSLMASHLPGRTDNEIKNYWNSSLSRRTYRYSSSKEPHLTAEEVIKMVSPSKRGGRTSQSLAKKYKGTTSPVKALMRNQANENTSGMNKHNAAENIAPQSSAVSVKATKMDVNGQDLHERKDERENVNRHGSFSSQEITCSAERSNSTFTVCSKQGIEETRELGPYEEVDGNLLMQPHQFPEGEFTYHNEISSLEKGSFGTLVNLGNSNAESSDLNICYSPMHVDFLDHPENWDPAGLTDKLWSEEGDFFRLWDSERE